MVWFYPTYHERYCTSACNKVRERRKWGKPLSAFIFLRLQRQLLFFYLNLQKITLTLHALIAPRKETQIHIEVRQIWPVLYWSNCGQNFLQNKKLCRMMKKRPFSRVLSLKNGLFANKRNFRYGLHRVAKLHWNATQEVYATDRQIRICWLYRCSNFN